MRLPKQILHVGGRGTSIVISSRHRANIKYFDLIVWRRSEFIFVRDLLKGIRGGGFLSLRIFFFFCTVGIRMKSARPENYDVLCEVTRKKCTMRSFVSLLLARCCFRPTHQTKKKKNYLANDSGQKRFIRAVFVPSLQTDKNKNAYESFITGVHVSVMLFSLF